MTIPQSSLLEFYGNIAITDGETIPFKSRAQLEAYFAAHKKFDTQTNLSYVRHSGNIKVKLTPKEIEQCNYMMFSNPDFENIKYYCRIMDWEYVNNAVVRVYYEIDVWLTYFDKVNYEAATIEREHLSEAGYARSLENPYDPGIFEFQTEEGLPVSVDMEEAYFEGSGDNYDFGVFPPVSSSEASYGVIALSDFDKSALGDIDTFYSYFESIVKPNGDVIDKTGAYVTTKKINVGRAFWLCAATITNPVDHNVVHPALREQSNLSKAIEWLTKNGLESNIIGIFQVPLIQWLMYLEPDTSASDLIVSPRKYEVQNKKLLLFPYQYLRVYTNGGDVKEYKYEKFIDLMLDGNGHATFKYMTLFDNNPMTSLVPVGYNISGANAGERIDDTEFPQIGYSTDAYLAFINNQMSKNLLEKTGTVQDSIVDSIVRAKNDLESYEFQTRDRMAPGLQGLKDAWSDATHEMAGIGNGAASDVLSYLIQNAGGLKNPQSLPTWNYKEAAREWRAGDNTQAASALASAKPAFVSYDYHPGSTNGILGYYLPSNKMAPGSYRFLRTKLKNLFLSVFDRYFTLYGYKSGRIGNPRILNYISGKTEDLPHFATYGEHKITYIKTSNLHVNYVKSSVSRTIESMFNSGIRFTIPPDMPEV